MAQIAYRSTIAVLVGTVVLAGCGGGGGGSVKRSAAALEDAYRLIRDHFGSSDLIRRPTTPFRVPPAIPQTANAATRANPVHTAADDLALLAQRTPRYAKTVACTDFGFYVQTGRLVPTEEEFVMLLARQLLSRVLTDGPAYQFRQHAESIRQAITRAKTDTEKARNAVIVAVCSF